jgi:predicted transcriptional regulator YdeE
MELVTITSKDVKGISIRTDNALEANSATAKIGGLWERFFNEITPSLSHSSKVYGLYTNYESDHTGAFDVVACSDDIDTSTLSGYQIQHGQYLVFKGTGPMPQIVVDLWRQVWDYFASPESKHQRAFTTDFEFYRSENSVELYISVV